MYRIPLKALLFLSWLTFSIHAIEPAQETQKTTGTYNVHVERWADLNYPTRGKKKENAYKDDISATLTFSSEGTKSIECVMRDYSIVMGSDDKTKMATAPEVENGCLPVEWAQKLKGMKYTATMEGSGSDFKWVDPDASATKLVSFLMGAPPIFNAVAQAGGDVASLLDFPKGLKKGDEWKGFIRVHYDLDSRRFGKSDFPVNVPMTFIVESDGPQAVVKGKVIKECFLDIGMEDHEGRINHMKFDGTYESSFKDGRFAKVTWAINAMATVEDVEIGLHWKCSAEVGK